MKRLRVQATVIMCLLSLLTGGSRSLAQEAQLTKPATAANPGEPAAKPKPARKPGEAQSTKPATAANPGDPAAKPKPAQKPREARPFEYTFKLLGARLNGDLARSIKGAPYSATAISEHTQTLTDGNQIVQRDQAAYYRDSEGRIRIEQTLKNIGKWVAAGEPKRIIMIADPVAGHSYYLDPTEHKATKAPLSNKRGDQAKSLREVMQKQRQASTKQRQAFEEQRAKQKRLFDERWEKQKRALAEQRPRPGRAVDENWAKNKQMFEEQRAKERQVFNERMAKQKQEFDEQFVKQKQRLEEQSAKIKQSVDESLLKRSAGSQLTLEKQSVTVLEPTRGKKTERLGKQVIEGVEAEGTRATVTIPAGEIGNTLPIYIIDENWYSSELKMPVMTRHHDPRSGDTVFRLTNISRAEPARQLFEVPAEYRIVEEPRARFGSFPVEPKSRIKPATSDMPKPQPKTLSSDTPKPQPKPLEPVKPASQPNQ